MFWKGASGNRSALSLCLERAIKPFPPTEELQFLLAEEPCLQVIRVGPYKLDLLFDNGCVIAVEHSITYVGPSGDTTTYGKEWRNEQPIIFHRLLERQLVGVEAREWTLQLRFEGDERLIVHSNSSPYEAGQIGSSGEQQLIVF